MKKLNQFFYIIFIFPSIILLLSGCVPQPKDVTKEIADANKNFMQAFDSTDAAVLSDCYVADAKLFPPNSDVVVGNENIQKAFQGFMDNGISKAELETVNAESYGNVANEEGRYKLYVGDKEVDQGKYIVVWKKVNGQWKMFRDIFNSSNPAPVPWAAVGDTVWIIQNKIKPNKVAQFEEFNFKYLEPAAMQVDPSAHNSVRTLKPVEANRDGTYTYYYIMDPVLPGVDYDMMVYLEPAYGKEKADEYMKMLSDCLVGGDQTWVKTIQSSW